MYGFQVSFIIIKFKKRKRKFCLLYIVSRIFQLHNISTIFESIYEKIEKEEENEEEEEEEFA